MGVALSRRRGRTAVAETAAGFSLIEALVAALLLAVVVLATIPLFSSATRNTLAGRELSVASQHGRSEVEELHQLPLDRLELTVPDGLIERAASEHLAWGDDGWTAGVAPGTAPWERTTVVRQYNVRDLYEEGRLTTPLPGGTPPGSVHLREVFVEVEIEREPGPLGRGRRVVLSTVRGF